MLLMIIALIGFTIASYMDIKSQYVSDYLQDILIWFGVLAQLILFLFTKNIYPLFWMSISMITLVPISYLLYILGLWGGGDVKSVAMVSTLIPYFNGKEIIIPMAINFLFVSAIYSIFLTAGYGIKKKLLNKIDWILIGVIIIVSTLAFIYLNKLLAWTVVLLSILIFSPTIKRIDDAMEKVVSVNDLMEGDWIIEEVKKNGKVIYKPRKEGISEREIEKLKKVGIKKVRIKYGIPLIPSFLITILVTIFYGLLL